MRARVRGWVGLCGSKGERVWQRLWQHDVPVSSALQYGCQNSQLHLEADQLGHAPTWRRNAKSKHAHERRAARSPS